MLLFLFAFAAFGLNREFGFCVDLVALEFGFEAFVRQIEHLRMLPVVVHDFRHALHYLLRRARSIASSRRLSKLPGARLIEPTMTRLSSIRSILA